MIDVVMPQMGESIVEGTLTKWLKKPGEHVERDEPLFEISTDKVDTEIPAPAGGTLAEVLVEEGKTVAIHTVVARIEEGAGAADQPQAPQPSAEAAAPIPPPPALELPRAAAGAGANASTPAQQPAAQAAPSTGGNGQQADMGPLSPIVRKMAREFNIDLKQIKGTGAGGRVTKHDVEAYLAAQGGKTLSQAYQQPIPAGAGPYPIEPQPVAQTAVAAPPPPAQRAPQMPAQAAAPPAPPLPRAETAKARVEPMSNMRQKIAEHMIFSKRTSAHVTTVHKADLTKIAKIRARLKEEFQARYGFSLTYLPFVVRAAAEALRTYPILNASIDGNNIIYHNEINIGIAVALDGGNGLIVPVIRNADEKNVVGLQRAIVDLATRARSRQLKPDEVTGGTFSITNFGSFGSIFATPVINQPQVAILGVGAVEKTPVVIDDAIAIRSIAHLALTFDHRLVDGALADQFTAKVKSVLENWSGEVL